jgi:hypothetical protein
VPKCVCALAPPCATWACRLTDMLGPAPAVWLDSAGGGVTVMITDGFKRSKWEKWSLQDSQEPKA